MVRVLLVEDDKDTSRLFAKYLERAGFAVAETHDGEEGLRAFAAGPSTGGLYDLVIVDGLLPKKNGFEVVAALRKLPNGKGAGVVMMTAAFKTPQAKKEAFAAGVDAFFAKPFVLNDLKEKLGELLVQRGKLPPREAGREQLPQVMAAPDDELPLLEPLQRRTKGGPQQSFITPLPVETTVQSPGDVARHLLTCARHRLSGIARFTDGNSELQIAFLHGVVVGANDNMREQLLGERLWKQRRLTTEQMRALNARIAERGERVAEALLALGLCTAEEALGLVADQLSARVRRALLWTGKLHVVEDEPEALRRAVEPIDLLDVVIAFGVEPAQQDEAARFVASRIKKSLERTPAFDDVLLAVARAHPDAQLPALMLSGDDVSVAEAASSTSMSELYACWLAGLVRLADDPPTDSRSLPATVRSEAASALVDRDAAAEVSGWLLRARGRSAWELFDVPRDAPASTTMVRERLGELTARVGPDALAQKKLGPAAGAARELWSWIDEQLLALEVEGDEIVIEEETGGTAGAGGAGAPAPALALAPAGDDDDLIEIDESAPTTSGTTGSNRRVAAPPAAAAAPARVAPVSPLQAALQAAAPAAAKPNFAPEDAFLEGQQLLTGGDPGSAKAHFERALAAKPSDPEYAAWLGWSEILTGDEQGGLKRLASAAREHPQAMRPMFFLGMHAQRQGDNVKAKVLLQECARRSPHDVEVQVALGLVT